MDVLDAREHVRVIAIVDAPMDVKEIAVKLVVEDALISVQDALQVALVVVQHVLASVLLHARLHVENRVERHAQSHVL